MVTELKTFEWTCDRCGASELVHSYHQRRPYGWEREEVHGCGLTGYTKDIDICAACASKAEL